MSPFKKVTRFLSISLLILSLSALAFADTIRLKDGSIIKGRIISFSGGKFVLIVGEGERQRQLTFFADEVESIQFDNGMSLPNNSALSNDVEKREPSFSKVTDGNDTIITVGAKRRDNGGTSGSDTSLPNPAVSSSNDSDGDIPEEDVADDGIIDDGVIEDDDPIVIDDSTGSDAGPAKPIQIPVRVLADDTSNGWTNAGWVVKKGQKIRIIANGRVSLGNGRTSGPQGISTLPDQGKLIKDKPTGSLIAVIGDDNNDFIFVGDNREFVAQRDGALFLGVNEGNIGDNSGAFDVIVEIEAESN